MLRKFFIAIICMSLLLSGCYAPRSYSPLAKEHWPDKTTAVLPVSPDDILSYAPDFPAEKVAQVANAVINTETKSIKDKIVGPAELLSILGDEQSLKDLIDSLNAPLGENWKVQKLSKFSKKTGIKAIVRVNVQVSLMEIDGAGPFGGYEGVNKEVVGPVEVNAELIDLSFIPPRIIYRSTGSAKYESNIGIEVGGSSTGIAIIPYAYGKTFGRALDQATRKALSNLFQQESKPNDRFIEHISGLVRDKNTGLEWIAGPDIDTTLDEAKSWVNNLSIGGGGWRLPTIMELTTIGQSSSGWCSIATPFKTSGWWVWSENQGAEGTFYKFSLFNCNICFTYCDSSKKTRCFAVRSK